MEFKRRYKAPEKDNQFYYSKLNWEYPKYVDECTWYAWGRLEELGIPIPDLNKHLPKSNAENWYTDTKYEKRSYPTVGDVLCYSAGKIHHKEDGMGHVAIVEAVDDNLNINISESGHNMKFKTRTLKPPYKYYLNVPNKDKYKLDGFIHCTSYDNVFEFTKGKYEVLYNKYLRTSPEVKLHNKALYKNLNDNAKSKTYPDNGYARYRIGAEIDIKEFAADSKGNIWGRTNQLWLCVQDKSGYQVKKVL